jgi:GNAT superfamily N-acetyltransferase
MKGASAADILARISAVRAQASQYVTNLFATPERLEQWVQWYPVEEAYAGEGALVVLKEDRGIQHLYYAAASPEDLGAALDEGHLPEGPIVADIVGREPDVEAQRAVFAQRGFQSYEELRRMARVAKDAWTLAPDEIEDVALAEAGDVEAIAAALDGSLDKLSEQIPTRGEIAAAVETGNILVVRAGDDLAGLLFHETSGRTSVLRHWLVMPAYRGQGVGARLMHRYFADGAGVSRFLLWVIAANENAIKRYKHYDYDWDGLVDHVMVRGGDAS